MSSLLQARGSLLLRAGRKGGGTARGLRSCFICHPHRSTRGNISNRSTSHLEVPSSTHAQGRSQHHHQRVALVQRQVDGPACKHAAQGRGRCHEGGRAGLVHHGARQAATGCCSAALPHADFGACVQQETRGSKSCLTSCLIHCKCHVSQLLCALCRAALQWRAALVRCLQAWREPEAAGKLGLGFQGKPFRQQHTNLPKRGGAFVSCSERLKDSNKRHLPVEHFRHHILDALF